MSEIISLEDDIRIQIVNYGEVSELPEDIAEAIGMDEAQFLADFYNPESEIYKAYQEGQLKGKYRHKLNLQKEGAKGNAFKYEQYLRDQEINEMRKFLWE